GAAVGTRPAELKCRRSGRIFRLGRQGRWSAGHTIPYAAGRVLGQRTARAAATCHAHRPHTGARGKPRPAPPALGRSVLAAGNRPVLFGPRRRCRSDDLRLLPRTGSGRQRSLATLHRRALGTGYLETEPRPNT